MSVIADPAQRRAITMIRDWWELHPEDDPANLPDDVQTNLYRATLWHSINAASDGELGTLIPHDRDGFLTWIFVVGIAASPVPV